MLCLLLFSSTPFICFDSIASNIVKQLTQSKKGFEQSLISNLLLSRLLQQTKTLRTYIYPFIPIHPIFKPSRQSADSSKGMCSLILTEKIEFTFPSVPLGVKVAVGRTADKPNTKRKYVFALFCHFLKNPNTLLIPERAAYPQVIGRCNKRSLLGPKLKKT